MHDALTATLEAWGQRVLAAIDACIDGHAAADVAAIGKALSKASAWPGCPRAEDFCSSAAEASYRRIPLGRKQDYEALLILWPPGHVTPIHDHQGLWGLEYVLDGVLEVQSFALTLDPAIHLEPKDTLVAGIGDYLVFSDADYAHRCRNFSRQRQSLTLHVYGGRLDSYRSFHTDGDAWSSELHDSVREEPVI